MVHRFFLKVRAVHQDGQRRQGKESAAMLSSTTVSYTLIGRLRLYNSIWTVRACGGIRIARKTGTAIVCNSEMVHA